MRYCSIDVETCGLNSDTCDILEFGAVLDDLKIRRSLSELPTFHCYFVLPEYKGEPSALSMHAEIFKRISEREGGFLYLNPQSFGNMFKQFLLNHDYDLEKGKVTINVAGKNFSSFDLPFLHKKTDLVKHVNIRQRVIDPSILFLTSTDKTLPNLSECKKRAKMPNSKVYHDAISDALDVVSIVRKGLEFKSFV